MNDDDKRRYIDELFNLCPTNSILIINHKGQVERIYCPFTVLVIRDVPGLTKGSVEAVVSIKMDLKLIDIYIVKGNAYYHFNFILWLDHEQ